MTVATVSTYGSLQTLLQHMNQVQNDLNTDQVQVSSGYVSQTFDGLNGSVEQFTALNAQISSLNNFQSNNTTVISQLNITATALGQIQQVATSIKSLIAGQMSGTASSASFSQQLQAYQNSLISELNSTYAGNYIFSGTKTNTQPVQNPLPSLPTDGTLSNVYYQGNSQSAVVQVSQNQAITTDVNAGNTAFQQIFAGIAQALASGGNTDQLKNAENLVDTGLQSTISLQATVNANVVNVQQIDSQSQSIQTYYQGITDTISKSDIVSLSTKVAQDQTVLQASFETFARISGLTLANYLK